MTAAALGYWQRATGRRPIVLGHRGVRGPAVRVTENTLGAFELAIEAGADGVELDVRLAQDGAVVVVHDATLTRISLGEHTSRVDELSLAELRVVELPGAQRIATLEEVLSWSLRHQCRVNIELKHEAADPAPLVEGVARVVASAQHPERLLFSSFDRETVLALGARLEGHVIAWLTETTLDLNPELLALPGRGVVAIHPKHTLLDRPALDVLRQHFSLVNTWTVNDPKRVAELAGLGVDTIITDDPRAALAALANS